MNNSQLVYKDRNGKERKVYGNYIVLNRENTCLDIELALNELKDKAERALKEEGLEKHLQDVQYIIKAQNFNDGNPPFPLGNLSEPGKITVAWKLVVEEDLADG